MQPREFFIEDRLEKYRLKASCNLGESGIRNFQLGQILDQISIDWEDLRELNLDDSPNQGSMELRKEIAKLYSNGITEKNVLVTTGTSEALFIFFHLVLKPKDQVSILMPAFQALYEIPIMLGANIRKVETKFSDLINEDNKLVIINHPHNPTGVALTQMDWELLERVIPNSKSIYLFDEHYRFLDLEGDNFRSGAGIHSNVVTTGSITKCFGVVGLKIGWLVANEEIISQARSFKDYTTHTVSPISEYITWKILQNRLTLIQPIKDRIKFNIQYLESRWQEILSIENFRKPDGGLVCFPKLKDGILSENYADQLYSATGVFVLPGINFEKEGYIRIGFGETQDRFKEGIEKWINWEKSKIA